MPIQRNVEHHRERLIEALKEEIIVMLEGELNDPRIGLCTVTDVILTPGGKSARVLVEIVGDEREIKQTVEALADARGFVRSTVRDRLGKRHIPELTFHHDRSVVAKARVEELLERVEKRKKV